MNLNLQDHQANQDQRLFQELKSGNMKAFDQLYHLYRNDFIRSASYKFSSSNQEDIIDAYQDALISFYEQIKNKKLIELSCSIKSFIFLLGYRYIIKYNKHGQRQIAKDSFDDSSLELADSIELMEKDIEQESLFKEIDLLPEQSRKLIMLRFVEGMSIPAIVKEMGYQSENSVSVTISRTLKKLKDSMNLLQNRKL